MKPRLGAQDRDPEPLEPLDRVVRGDRRDDLLRRCPPTAAKSISRRCAEVMPSAPPRRASVGEARRGEQRFRRDAAEIEAVAAHLAALDQHDLGAHLHRPGGDREPAGAGADDAQIGGERPPLMPALAAARRASACSRPEPAPAAASPTIGQQDARAERSARSGAALDQRSPSPLPRLA